jgi:hypothetical protein
VDGKCTELEMYRPKQPLITPQDPALRCMLQTVPQALRGMLPEVMAAQNLAQRTKLHCKRQFCTLHASRPSEDCCQRSLASVRPRLISYSAQNYIADVNPARCRIAGPPGKVLPEVLSNACPHSTLHIIAVVPSAALHAAGPQGGAARGHGQRQRAAAPNPAPRIAL